AVHGPAEQRFLTFDRSYWWFVFLRLTGESRNLRMGHSVRHPYLIPPFVVGKGLHLAEFQRDLVRRSAADRAYRFCIAARIERKNDGRRVAEIRNPQLLVPGVDEHAGRIHQTGAIAFDHASWSNITSIGSFKYEDRMPHVVGDVEIPGAGIDRHLRG